jgi:hypothetical protein
VVITECPKTDLPFFFFKIAEEYRLRLEIQCKAFRLEDVVFVAVLKTTRI